MENIFNYRLQTHEDFYKILGSDESSSTEQILTEYKILALEIHPDKNPDDKDALSQFQRLQEAKEVLTNDERRRSYDKWLNSGIMIPFRQWEDRSMNTRMTMHWARKINKDPMLTCSENCQQSSSSQTSATEGSAIKSKVVWSKDKDKIWNRDPAENETLRKFRSYEI